VLFEEITDFLELKNHWALCHAGRSGRKEPPLLKTMILARNFEIAKYWAHFSLISEGNQI